MYVFVTGSRRFFGKNLSYYLRLFSLKELSIGKQVIAVVAKYFRPTEVHLLISDPTKYKILLGWNPHYDLASLVSEVVAVDLECVNKEFML